MTRFAWKKRKIAPLFTAFFIKFYAAAMSSSSSSSAMDVVDSTSPTSSAKTVAFAGKKLLHLKFQVSMYVFCEQTNPLT